ncbi:hypothetical protein [Mangrovicoccus sp. HB161399]|uniref:hypothetical protein n=1 Tax=Mangrovicoccus sp. HB161399 TaxID=2720392 RepID=UPI001551BFBB|nr:hypothetical protein [Mangrovicoccus sp. HB161399]
MTLAPTDLHRRLDELREAARAGGTDPRRLFDEVQDLITGLEAKFVPVPADLREIEADLEADILEDFYDNLPV